MGQSLLVAAAKLPVANARLWPVVADGISQIGMPVHRSLSVGSKGSIHQRNRMNCDSAPGQRPIGSYGSQGRHGGRYRANARSRRWLRRASSGHILCKLEAPNHLGDAVNALFIAPFLDAPDQTFLSPRKVAQALNLQLSELAIAAGVHRNTLAARPQSPRVQAFLRDTLRVLNAAKEVFAQTELPIAWLLNEPLSAFRHKTAFELIAAGRTEAVLEYLNSFSAGFVG
jgi:hypothetical protein